MKNLLLKDIENIIQSKGYFYVSPRYRDITLAKRCRRYVREGKLVKVKPQDGRYGDYYKLPEKGIDLKITEAK